MMLARLCRTPLFKPNVTSLLKAQVSTKPVANVRLYATRERTSFRVRTGRVDGIGTGKWHEKAYSIGEKAVMGSTLIGAGALCYYGLGLSKKEGVIEKIALWPDYVRKRVSKIYQYVGGSVLITAGSVMMCLNSPAMLRIITTPGPMAFFVHMGLLMGSIWTLHSIPYTEGFGAKQIAWIACCSLLGTAVAPLCYFGGAAVARALATTAGAVGGLTIVALCAPDRKFLTWAGPLGLGLGAVFTASLAAPFTSPFSAVGASLYSISIYGGLILFSAFLLYDTQRAIAYAESYPPYPIPGQTFDPINAAMAVYMDILNIFMRLAAINSNKKK